ncbi:pre-rRNA-processing protein ESF2 [Ziziphus jujuba]|uniref:Pre-rRNA-processing protein ESF2 n=1 Tax=Ziziphus jujuba TaxID=326968 RepID=A0ABM3IWT1_ZIZJJ|nr:pre-rRNA-processing protein ESF2 [Ziziphus jujuba]XP_048336972.2 pre-rRNA-processing protein ESF2 [Ziziphus jujuba]XP_048336976.2 pre-rRNA-processing protein ESF2 [Ziziphus jujuba]
MEEDELQFNSKNGECNDEKEKSRKRGKKQKFVKDAAEAVEKLNHMKNPQEEENRLSNDGREGDRKTKKKKYPLKENFKTAEEEEMNRESAPNGCGDGLAESKKDKKKRYSEEADEGEEAQEGIKTISVEEGILQFSDGKAEIRKNKRKKRLLKEAAKAVKRGVCYLSRIPPHMNHLQLRHILSQYGDIQRIYLTPERENAAAQVRRKRKEFSEGWVEFSDKGVAKRVANMLNGEQIGGKKRSSFYYDIWNIKYLSKFKWDNLTEEIAYKNAIREQKLALEISAAKKERDFYLSKVDKSRALSAIEERLKKKQKHQQDSGTGSDLPVGQQLSKVVRQFPQTRPIADIAAHSKPQLSKDILSGVFGGLQ